VRKPPVWNKNNTKPEGDIPKLNAAHHINLRRIISADLLVETNCMHNIL